MGNICEKCVVYNVANKQLQGITFCIWKHSFGFTTGIIYPFLANIESVCCVCSMDMSCFCFYSASCLFLSIFFFALSFFLLLRYLCCIQIRNDQLV